MAHCSDLERHLNGRPDVGLTCNYGLNVVEIEGKPWVCKSTAVGNASAVPCGGPTPIDRAHRADRIVALDRPT